MTDEPSAQNSVAKSGRSNSKEEVSDPCREGKDKNWAHLSHRKPGDGDSETLATVTMQQSPSLHISQKQITLHKRG